jgi:hypothetical protein
MMAQIQTKIKDSDLRLILPSQRATQQIRTPRRYSREDNFLIDASEEYPDSDSDKSYTGKQPRTSTQITFQDLDDEASLREPPLK